MGKKNLLHYSFSDTFILLFFIRPFLQFFHLLGAETLPRSSVRLRHVTRSGEPTYD